MMIMLLCSGVLFSVSFLCPSLGWLMLVSITLLFVSLRHMHAAPVSSVILQGWLWGIIAYGLHFWWLFQFLMQHYEMNVLLAGLIYGYIAIMFSLASAVLFFLITRLFSLWYHTMAQALMFSLSLFSYDAFLSRYGLWFLGVSEGYPFLSPLLSVSGYRWMWPIIAFAGTITQGPASWQQGAHRLTVYERSFNEGSPGGECNLPLPLPIFYLKPDGDESYKQNPVHVGGCIYQKLVSLALHQKLGDRSGVVIAPEATFPFPLNEYPEQVRLWCEALPKKVQFILGAYRSEAKKGVTKTYQSSFCLRPQAISLPYDKTHLIPFVERIPKTLTSWLTLKNIFFSDTVQLSKGKTKVPPIFGGDYCQFRPQICSELFWRHSFGKATKNEPKPEPIVLWLVKDCWFPPYFRQMLERFASLRALQMQRPLLYVTFEKVIYFQPHHAC